ncbi:MAG: hypothetical protein GY863_10400 [bacterium]|nr:hypothetical protein [bacterium]
MNSKRLIVSLMACVLLVITFTGDSPAQVTEDFLKFFEYRETGPTRQSGRFVDFAVVEETPWIFYAASGSGGLWKTENHGLTYEPVFDNENVISIGAVAVSQSNPDIVYVGSGESNNSRSMYWGDGVYKSTDGGETWTNMGLKESHHIGRVVVHPKNPDIVYVAAAGHLYSENEERGLYKSTNGGETWTKSLDIVVNGKNMGVIDVVMDPKSNNTLYACTYDKVRVPYSFDLGGPGSGIYKTTNAGRSWTKLTNGLPGGMLGRIGIDVYHSNPNILYATVENANKKDMSDEERYQELLDHKSSRGMIGGEIYRSDNKGRSWRKVNPDDQPIGGGPAYYYGQIIIDPNDDKTVHVMSAGSYVTKDGGETWTGRTPRFGGDDHALWINPDNSLHQILGYDHGMGVTFDGGQNWFHPDYQPLAQFYAIGVDMEYPYNVYGGLQDNGSKKGPSTKRDGSAIRFEDWHTVGGGDGFYNVVDPVDSRWLYNESQFGVISRLDQLTGERVSIRPRDSKLRNNWNSPIMISPHDHNRIYFGTNKLLKSNFKGEGWQEVSPDLTTNDPAKLVNGKGGDGNIQYCTITTISESPVQENVIWAGTDDGNIQMTKNGGRKWDLLNDNISGNPGYWVSRVTASNHYPGTAYVSYTGLRRDDFRPFVYKTTDFGETWTSIAGNLPIDEPVNDIIEDHKNPNLLFLGSEKAVYVSINGGQSWTKMKNNMPTNGCQDILIHPRENDLVVGTHGRGAFITDITPLQELTPEVMSKNAHLFDIETKVKWVDNNFRVYAHNNYNGQSEPVAVKINYYLRNDVNQDVKVTIFQGARRIHEFSGAKTAGLNSITWHMDKIVSERSDRQIESMIQRMRRFGREMTVDELKYVTAPVDPGEFTVTFSVGSTQITKKAVILTDTWYDK